MRAGQKSIRGGIEDFLCPFADINISQGPNEAPTHQGTMAIDVYGEQSGVRYPYYAPATIKCVWTYPDSGQAMWQTVNNVRCSNGYIGKVTFMTVHDDTFDAYRGMVRQQGEQIGNMGMKGYATGVHCHSQYSQSDDRSWYQNGYGNYQFNNEVDPENVWFMNDTNILSGYGAWKYLSDVPVDEPKPKPADNSSKEIEKLKNELEEAKSQNKALTLQLKATEEQNKVLEQQKTAMESEFNAYKESASQIEKEAHRLLFIAPNDDLYYIRLEKDQSLYINEEAGV